MPKRLIDTELWNNEQIVEDFTSDDRYFWLYLLTNPHGNICGVMKYSPIIMGRDMGLHKDTIENLVYRFEKNYKLIVVDRDTKELLILNWYKWNWNTSEKLMQSVFNSKETIKSENIKNLVQERINKIGYGYGMDRVSIGYAYPTNTNTNTISNTNTKIETNTYTSNDKDSNSNIVSLETINEYFDKTYAIYPRKVSKEQARETYEHKFRGLEQESARKLANYIYINLQKQVEIWKSENDNKGREQEFMPYMSTWLNDNVQDSPHYKRGKKR